MLLAVVGDQWTLGVDLSLGSSITWEGGRVSRMWVLGSLEMKSLRCWARLMMLMSEVADVWILARKMEEKGNFALARREVARMCFSTVGRGMRELASLVPIAKRTRRGPWLTGDLLSMLATCSNLAPG